MPKKIDLTGQKFGRWTVIDEAPPRYASDGKSIIMWNCVCDCGNTKTISSKCLRSGETKSCGCYCKEVKSITTSKRNRKYNQYSIYNDCVVVYIDNSDKFFYVDLEDLNKIKLYYWTTYKSDDREYICTVTNTNRKKVLLHKFILNELNSDNIIDHINHNTFDNRKKNLRVVTPQQNNYNHKKSKNNTSGVTGVYWQKHIKKWQAYINVNYKRLHLGVYTNFDDAVAARKAAEEKYFGEYSYDNSMRIAEQIKIG